MGFEFIEGFVCAFAVMGAIGFVVGAAVLWSPFDRLPQPPPAPPPYPNPYIEEARLLQLQQEYNSRPRTVAITAEGWAEAAFDATPPLIVSTFQAGIAVAPPLQMSAQANVYHSTLGRSLSNPDWR